MQDLAAGSAGEVLQQIQTDLMAEPERGVMVKGLGGLRKARVGNPSRGKGKRGGFRYLYIYLEKRSHVHLLFLLDKDEQEDLDNDQRKHITALVKQLKG